MLQISRRPLSASAADQALFVNRSDDADFVMKSLRLGFNVLVVGEPNSGRTSFLHHVACGLTRANKTTIVLDVQPYDNALDTVYAIQAALGNDVGRVRRHESSTPPATERLFFGQLRESTSALFDHDIDAMGAASRDKVTILLDNVTVELATLLFGRFRDIVWRHPHQWVVVGALATRTRYLEPPADAFFDAVAQLEEFSEEDCRKLLRRRIEAATGSPEAEKLDANVDQVIRILPDRLPGTVLAAARFVVLAPDPSISYRKLSAMQNRAASLGRSEGMLFNELEALGPVHAGDERLLRRLGYTRERIVQLLKKLEGEGLVRSWNEGRRRVYAINLEAPAQR